LEPLQKGAEKMIIDIDASKVHIEWVVRESGELLKEPIMAQTIDIVENKSAQVNSQVIKFQAGSMS